MAMRVVIIVGVLFILSTAAAAQISVKELDQDWQKKTRHQLSLFKEGNRKEGLAISYFKEDKRIYSIEKRMTFGTGKVPDSASSLQFAYYNDTLIRIYFSRITSIDHKNGFCIAYVTDKKIIAQTSKGDIYFPDMDSLQLKADQWLQEAKEKLKGID